MVEVQGYTRRVKRSRNKNGTWRKKRSDAGKLRNTKCPDCGEYEIYKRGPYYICENCGLTTEDRSSLLGRTSLQGETK